MQETRSERQKERAEQTRGKPDKETDKCHITENGVTGRKIAAQAG